MKYSSDAAQKHFKAMAQTTYLLDPLPVVTMMLLELGVASNSNGYHYLKKAILLRIENPVMPFSGGIYDVVGKSFGPVAGEGYVEQAIRNAIKKAWEIKDDDVWICYFLTTKDGKIKKPSNTEFISQIVEALVVWRGFSDAFKQNNIGEGVGGNE